jgi:hypothetical protein
VASLTTSTSPDRHTNPTQNSHSSLRVIHPEQLDREFLVSTKESPRPIKLDENAQYLGLAIYLISNNILEDKDFSKVVGYFEH